MSNHNNNLINRISNNNLNVKIHYLDDTLDTLKIDNRSTGSDLFHRVAHKLHLIESYFFGLQFTSFDNNVCWLDMRKQVKKQINKDGECSYKFTVKFYTPDPNLLHDQLTKELYIQQLKRDISTGEMVCCKSTCILLGALFLQLKELHNKNENQKQNMVEYLQDVFGKDNVTEDLISKCLEFKETIKDQDLKETQYQLLEIARKTDSYGVKMHPAKDNEGLPLNLAVYHMGIIIFQKSTKVNTFNWSKIRKLSFKRKRFLIKLHPEEYGYFKDTLEFYFDTRNSCKNFWKKCIEHHSFFRTHHTCDTIINSFSTQLHPIAQQQQQKQQQLQIQSSNSAVFHQSPNHSSSINNYPIYMCTPNMDLPISSIPGCLSYNSSLSTNSSINKTRKSRLLKYASLKPYLTGSKFRYVGLTQYELDQLGRSTEQYSEMQRSISANQLQSPNFSLINHRRHFQERGSSLTRSPFSISKSFNELQTNHKSRKQPIDAVDNNNNDKNTQKDSKTLTNLETTCKTTDNHFSSLSSINDQLSLQCLPSLNKVHSFVSNESQLPITTSITNENPVSKPDQSDGSFSSVTTLQSSNTLTENHMIGLFGASLSSSNTTNQSQNRVTNENVPMVYCNLSVYSEPINQETRIVASSTYSNHYSADQIDSLRSIMDSRMKKKSTSVTNKKHSRHKENSFSSTGHSMLPSDDDTIRYSIEQSSNKQSFDQSSKEYDKFETINSLMSEISNSSNSDSQPVFINQHTKVLTNQMLFDYFMKDILYEELGQLKELKILEKILLPYCDCSKQEDVSETSKFNLFVQIFQKQILPINNKFIVMIESFVQKHRSPPPSQSSLDPYHKFVDLYQQFIDGLYNPMVEYRECLHNLILTLCPTINQTSPSYNTQIPLVNIFKSLCDISCSEYNKNFIQLINVPLLQGINRCRSLSIFNKFILNYSNTSTSSITATNNNYSDLNAHDQLSLSTLIQLIFENSISGFIRNKITPFSSNEKRDSYYLKQPIRIGFLQKLANKNAVRRLFVLYPTELISCKKTIYHTFTLEDRWSLSNLEIHSVTSLYPNSETIINNGFYANTTSSTISQSPLQSAFVINILAHSPYSFVLIAESPTSCTHWIDLIGRWKSVPTNHDIESKSTDENQIESTWKYCGTFIEMIINDKISLDWSNIVFSHLLHTSGYLLRQYSSHHPVAWQRLWVELGDRCLRFYTSHEHQDSPITTLSLSNTQIYYQPDGCLPDCHRDKLWLFQLEKSGRKSVFRTENYYFFLKWIESIKYCIDLC